MKQVSQKTTIYFELATHKALRQKATNENRSISDIVNEAVALFALEDTEDIAAFDSRQTESAVNHERFLKMLERDGTL
jgi:hypothetical protein